MGRSQVQFAENCVPVFVRAVLVMLISTPILIFITLVVLISIPIMMLTISVVLISIPTLMFIIPLAMMSIPTMMLIIPLVLLPIVIIIGLVIPFIKALLVLVVILFVIVFAVAIVTVVMRYVIMLLTLAMDKMLMARLMPFRLPALVAVELVMERIPKVVVQAHRARVVRFQHQEAVNLSSYFNHVVMQLGLLDMVGFCIKYVSQIVLFQFSFWNT